MLKPKSIIKRREPLDDGYDDAIVIGPSPVSSPATSGGWPSSGGHQVIVQPTKSFGDNEVMPIDYILANYDITEPVVDPGYPIQAPPVYAHQPSPEEAFAAEAKANPPKPKAAPQPLTPEEIKASAAAAKAGARKR